jgi:L-rhamnose-H+ transport protein
MTDSTVPGTMLVVAAGIASGFFTLPMKFARNWAWEHIWLVYSVVGLALMPWLAALSTIPNLMAVFAAAGPRTLLMTATFGFAWGVANVLFGRAVAMVGMALTFAVVSGLSAASGSLVPLILKKPERLVQASGLVILLGVAMVVTGVALLGIAGRQREKRMAPQGASGSILFGLVLCVISGLFGAMLNLSFTFGEGIKDQAVRSGASASSGTYAIWAIALLGGLVSNGGYAALQLTRNKNWSRFCQPGFAASGSLSALMGVLFTGGLFLYGQGATLLGPLGAVIGWPVLQSVTIGVSTGAGAATGEWRGADRRFIVLNVAGLAILVAAIVVLSIGNRL